jgi:hypothetical protein
MTRLLAPVRRGKVSTATPSTITERELEQVKRANAATATPVVFIHGLWLLPSSWDPWAALFEAAGYIDRCLPRIDAMSAGLAAKS